MRATLNVRRSGRVLRAPERFRFSAFRKVPPAVVAERRAPNAPSNQVARLHQRAQAVSSDGDEEISDSGEIESVGDALHELKQFLDRVGGFAVEYEGSEETDASFTATSECSN